MDKDTNSVAFLTGPNQIIVATVCSLIVGRRTIDFNAVDRGYLQRFNELHTVVAAINLLAELCVTAEAIGDNR
jgi:hypothetical protein